VALTFDDGPYNYTNHILDLLDSYDAKATFFITGNNIGKGEIDDPTTQWPGIIRRMYNSNHQIASHTWSHQDLSAISAQQMQNQIYYNEMAFRNILGFFPQYMRPPYSSCTTACEQFLEQAGYHVIYFDLDSEDYLNDDPHLIQHSKNDINGNFSTIANPNWLIIEHDIHFETAYNLTEYTLSLIKARGLKAVTVGECMGDEPSNWYRSAQDRQVVSQDGKCGNSANTICTKSSFGSCCSEAGWW
jgi:peptidoglycan/xylan/chitin deacetylase (PgdA/CDA1 family)